ncbi:MAG: DUF192 domain-containing protein [Pseudomonadota bacterium]
MGVQVGSHSLSVRGAAATVALIAALAAAWTAAAAETVTLTVRGASLQAEVADTPAERARGLMYRERLAADAGMLFVYETPEIQHMWMKNTLIPLSVAFIDADGRIVGISDMAPMSEVIHGSAAPAQFALEANRGWFARHGVRPGDRVQGLERWLADRAPARSH